MDIGPHRVAALNAALGVVRFSTSCRFSCRPLRYGLTIRCWATIRDTVGWLTL
jgi:hypothetical protein